MAVESTTTIAGLNALWPQGTDVKAEGDDHIRLIKSVLKAEFPTGSAGTVVATAQTRNRIVNGAMQILQEFADGSGPAPTAVYICDQWLAYVAAGGPTVSYAARTSAGPVSPYGSTTRLFLNTTVAKGSLAAGDIMQVYQLIEGTRVRDLQWGTVAAKQIVVRLMCRAPVAGNYVLSIRNGAFDRSWLGSFNIPVADTDTIVTMVVPGDTGGTWAKDTTNGLTLAVIFAAGTTWHGVAGWQAGDKRGLAGMANAGSVVGQPAITDVGLYLDPSATGKAPAWVMPDEAQELLACQRYYLRTSAQITTYAAGGTTFGISMPLGITMRTTPAMSTSGFAYLNASGGALAGGSVGATNYYTLAANATATGQTIVNANTVSANARM